MKKIISLLLLSILFSQCIYDDYEPINYDTNANDNNGSDTGSGTGTATGSGGGTGTTTSNKITYLKDVQPILNQLCVSCHGAINPKDDLNISTYALAKNKIDKIISSMSKQSGEVMPPTGRVANNLIQTMKDWKTDGLLEGEANSSGGTGTTTIITYTANIQPILTQQCNACHGLSNASANLNLTSYATAKAKIDIIISRIDLQNGQSGIMPTSGRMSVTNIQAFKDWKTQGFIQ